MLIFMKFSNESTEDDVQTYRSILLTTNAHRCESSLSNEVMGNKGYKYENIIAPLMWEKSKKVGTGIHKRVDLLHMTLNDNKIDYIHWDDPNNCGSSAIARGLTPGGSQWTTRFCQLSKSETDLIIN